MPSPFPGMDPYLEHPALWPDVHHELLSVIRERLNELVRARYVVRIEQRTYVSDESDPGRTVIVPDLRVVKGAGTPASHSTSAGSVAVAEPIVATTLIEEEIREHFLRIVDADNREVVTVVELLSPMNKHPRAYGLREYRRKRHEVLTSSTHLVEIDLLRTGERIPVHEPLPEHDYLVHVSRTEERPHGRLWPIRLQESLPTIPVPLLEADEFANVDLQAVLGTAYERGAYDADVDYAGEPVPPLTEVERTWAEERLRPHLEDTP